MEEHYLVLEVCSPVCQSGMIWHVPYLKLKPNSHMSEAQSRRQEAKKPRSQEAYPTKHQPKHYPTKNVEFKQEASVTAGTIQRNFVSSLFDLSCRCKFLSKYSNSSQQQRQS
jgi:hypothetical protein